eukprot:scaffold3506_cov73-Isochrysis_galbana.AAC.1
MLRTAAPPHTWSISGAGAAGLAPFGRPIPPLPGLFQERMPSVSLLDRMPQVLLLGNKTDLNHIRAVTIAKHEAFADENSMCGMFGAAVEWSLLPHRGRPRRCGVVHQGGGGGDESGARESRNRHTKGEEHPFDPFSFPLAGVVLSIREEEVATKVVH